MPRKLLFRDPRTVARDIPGVLDILFPRLTGSLVASLNRSMFTFDAIKPLSEEQIAKSKLNKAMLFELSAVRAEIILSGNEHPDWNEVLELAIQRQQRYFNARIPNRLKHIDMILSEHASNNLIQMLDRIRIQNPNSELTTAPVIPGLGWISSGHGDFVLGNILIEVKHINRNFVSRDFRQVLMYWLLKYSASIENDDSVWTECLLINPRRNTALTFNFDEVLRSASASSNRVELLELLRSIVGEEINLL